MRAEAYIPLGRIGWWGKEDLRVRCKFDDKVVFLTRRDAQRSAEKANVDMRAYRGGCRHWHVSRKF